MLVTREGWNFWALYKMLDVTKDKAQLSCNINDYNDLRKFSNDDYLAIFKFKLLSYMVEVDLWLCKYCWFFRLKWVDLEGSPSFSGPFKHVEVEIKTNDKVTINKKTCNMKLIISSIDDHFFELSISRKESSLLN